jgi:hypothetical protein
MIKEIHIYDLDGTLVDSSHRYRTMFNGKKFTIDFPHWLENIPQYVKDTLLPLAEEYQANIADPECYVIICTSRVITPAELDWISDNLGDPDFLFTRKAGDFTSGTIIKTRQLSRFLNLKQFSKAVRFFYEDNVQYLYPVADAIGAVPVYCESEQGF